MKKLYENIEDIHIKGDIAQLADVITVMDQSLQALYQGTEDMFSLLVRYSNTNKGLQYEKVVNVAVVLRDELYEASVQLNNMQNEIVEYQNKVYKYEGLPQSASKPNAYMIERVQVLVETSEVRFTKSEMIDLMTNLELYSEAVYHYLQDIVIKKNSIALIWDDSQYRDFSDFVEQLTSETIEAIKIFDEYVSYLQEKIQELN